VIGYGLDDPVFESGRGKRLLSSTTSRYVLGVHPASY